MGFDPILVPMIKEYVFICAFSLFGMYLYQCLREFLMAYEIVKFPNLILVIALILSFKKVHPIIIIILSAILGIAAGYIA